MSKKKLIDAEKFKNKLNEMSNELYLPQDFSSSPYTDDLIAPAIYAQMGIMRVDFNNKMAESIKHVLQEISWTVEECTYRDHPCRLCQDSEEGTDPIENFGDIRESAKVANS